MMADKLENYVQFDRGSIQYFPDSNGYLTIIDGWGYYSTGERFRLSGDFFHSNPNIIFSTDGNWVFNKDQGRYYIVNRVQESPFEGGPKINPMIDAWGRLPNHTNYGNTDIPNEIGEQIRRYLEDFYNSQNERLETNIDLTIFGNRTRWMSHLYGAPYTNFNLIIGNYILPRNNMGMYSLKGESRTVLLDIEQITGKEEDPHNILVHELGHAYFQQVIEKYDINDIPAEYHVVSEVFAQVAEIIFGNNFHNRIVKKLQGGDTGYTSIIFERVLWDRATSLNMVKDGGINGTDYRVYCENLSEEEYEKERIIVSDKLEDILFNKVLPAFLARNGGIEGEYDYPFVNFKF